VIYKFIAFDIEIERSIPDGSGDWKSFRPLGISCAATMIQGEEPVLWFGKSQTAEPADRMTKQETAALVDYLETKVKDGFTVLTWNGLGFDFDILAEESGLLENCARLAYEHVDMMYHFFCVKGYALGLDKAAQGMGLSGKTPGMNGRLAPIYWREGKRKEVLDYVAQDVRTTLALAEAVERKKSLNWISNSGRDQYVHFHNGWKIVEDANALPLPDTSWMRNPWSRSKFTGWLP